MQTKINSSFNSVKEIADAESILRSCVHCGFCTATCPTYQLLGDELDSPRGRIYLIKNYLETGTVGASTQLHLDRCLACRSCETTCPSGVHYARLLDIGRNLIDRNVDRTLWQRVFRAAIRTILPYPKRVLPLLKLAHFFRPLYPDVLRRKLPPIDDRSNNIALDIVNPSTRKVVIFEGCVQSVVAQTTNNALRKILYKKGVQALNVPGAGCCSALCQHLSDERGSQQQMKNNIDAWWPLLEAGVEAILISASGCSAHIKEYAQLLKHDETYAAKAQKVSLLAWDVSTWLAKELAEQEQNEQHSRLHFKSVGAPIPIVFHSPCSLQHGLSITGVVESLLEKAGYVLHEVEDSHICCGSAGSYSLLQSKLSQALLGNKIRNLQRSQPKLIATANIGCQLHLQSATNTPVVHWLELLASRLQ